MTYLPSPPHPPSSTSSIAFASTTLRFYYSSLHCHHYCFYQYFDSYDCFHYFQNYSCCYRSWYWYPYYYLYPDRILAIAITSTIASTVMIAFIKKDCCQTTQINNVGVAMTTCSRPRAMHSMVKYHVLIDCEACVFGLYGAAISDGFKDSRKFRERRP